jgi:predicted ATPase
LEKLGMPESERAQWVRFARGLGEYPKQRPPPLPWREQKTNLPIPLTSFIGREKEIERIQYRLAEHRLVTLTGTGGIGKTRLSQRVADQLLDKYANGVWLVEFAPLNDPMLVPQSVATVLGIQQAADHSGLVEAIIDFLHAKTILLILDNCEHLLDACAGLADKLLKSCPNLKILATSRQALGIVGEALYQVPSLTSPEVHSISAIETLDDYESIRLFNERAQLVQMDFALTKVNASSVTQICSRLDGIPLAIELAAVRIQTLSVEQIADQLDQCFLILTGGGRTALPKHQTLQASIDWSWHLLRDVEQILLRRLSVFAGGWMSEAAEAVCMGDGLEADAVLDLMTQLVNKSLVIRESEPGHEARYHVLQTIRQYASERLLEAGEVERLRNRHLDFFLRWAEQVEPELQGPQQIEWLSQIEAELDNLRAALEWGSLQAEGGEESLRLASALLAFWRQRGYVREGRGWLATSLASQTAPSAGAARAKALHAAGYLARWQGDLTTARVVLEESVGLWRALGSADHAGLAQALATLAEVFRAMGNPATARSIVSEAITLFREQDDRWGLAFALSNLGLAIRDQDDFALARSVINEGVTLWRGLGDPWGLLVATRNLGLVAMRQGDYEGALRHFTDCLAMARTLGDEEQMAEALVHLGAATLNVGNRVQARLFIEECFNLVRESGAKSNLAICFYHFGYLAQVEGDNQQAKSFFEQELALARTTGPIWLGAQALLGLAGVAAANGQAWRAARLLGASEARARAAATYTDAADALYERRAVAIILAEIGETAFATARVEGQAMTFEQAADYALETEPSA